MSYQGDYAPGSGRDVMIGNLGSDPYELIHRLHEVGERRAKCRGIAYQLQELRKSVLSQIINEYMMTDEKMSHAKAEAKARADGRYKTHLAATAQAIEDESRADAEYWSLKSELEWDANALYHLNALSRLEPQHQP